MSSNSEDGFFLEDDEMSGQCPFLMIHGPELIDGRLTWPEKGLLWWLRLRGSQHKGKKTWVSWDSIAEDMGDSKATIKRRASRLRELGWMKCESRGLLGARQSAYENHRLCTMTICGAGLISGVSVSQAEQKSRSIDFAPLRSNLSPMVRLTIQNKTH